MGLVCPVLVAVYPLEVVLPITEQDGADPVPVCPVEVAQPQHGALVRVFHLPDHRLEGGAFLALLGEALLDLLLELHLPQHHHPGAVGRCAGAPGHTRHVRAGRRGHGDLHAAEALVLVVYFTEQAGVLPEPLLDVVSDRLVAHLGQGVTPVHLLPRQGRRSRRFPHARAPGLDGRSAHSVFLLS